MDDITARLAPLLRRHRVPGAQLAVRWRGRTFTAEAGEESSGAGRPVTGRSAFPLGSLTKPFTATLAMMLVADGDLDLDEPLAAYLPGLRPGAGRATLRQLLSHSAGFPANVEESAAGLTRRRWAETTAGAVHPPGSAFSYSNAGYLLVAHLIEDLTGMSWRAAVESFLLRPLGIEPLFAVGARRAAGGRPAADGHVVRPGGVALPIAEQSVTALEEPVAGLAGSASDLLALAALHLPGHEGPGLLDPASAAEMRRDQLSGLSAGAFGLADGWGLGWSLYATASGTWFGHDGTGDGAWCHLRVQPETGAAVALTTNGSNGAALWEALVEELRAAGLDVGHYPLGALAGAGTPLSGDAPANTGCAGRYANGSWTCAVEAADGGLYLSVGSGPRWRLRCFEDLRFTTEGSDAGSMPYIGRFLRDPGSGTIELVQITGRLARRHG
ncbi:serine hydrolase domain-containing protein [Nonomuraea zeae]|uniref:Beta-lactamase family protein n=1 Tax=Nonomuraea zeae TaxID=1642303 RepID=A0A5S4FGG5_9ACTN|nr:serine hydrolase domain-containing protein [Nonomuraea zeae]TMR18528.1 beta-lactamase family protein [Nonomuraea zeae]